MPFSPSIRQTHFGSTPQGQDVSLFILQNANIEVHITNFGGVITRILAPDAAGQPGDIALGFDELPPYFKDSPYFGAIIGRVGNRLAAGRFSLGERSWQLDCNDGDNHLHGGWTGFDKVVWTPTSFVTEQTVGLKLFYLSPNGDQGYPGNLQVMVTYTLNAHNELQVDYHAVTDQPTPVNLTQHTYFNLASGGKVLDHRLYLNADRFTPVKSGLIPTGELRPVEATPFDFREPKTIGRDIDAEDEQLRLGRGFDHNFVLNKGSARELSLAARVEEDSTGRVLEVLTTEPGVQFYSGNFLDASLSARGQTFGHRSGFCLEPQHYPDAPNQPGFPSILLEPGDEYISKTVFRFLTR